MEDIKKSLKIENHKEQEFIKLLKKSKISEVEVNSFLKKNIVDLNKLDKDGYNSLHHAIKSENPDIVNIILTINNEEENIKSTDKENQTNKANPNIKTEDSKKDVFLHPLHFANQEVNDPSSLSKIIKLLVKYGADVNSEDEFKCNILHRVAEKGNTDLVSYILSKHPGLLNSKSKCGSILHMAVSGDHIDLIEYLLNNTEIDLSIEDYMKNSALLFGIISKNFNSFKLILDFIKESKTMDLSKKKELINQKNEDHNTILHELAFAKFNILIDIMNKLDESIRIDPEEKNLKGHTYKDIQKDIIRLVKEKEDDEKRRKDELKAEKKRLILEKQRMEEEIIKEIERKAKEEEGKVKLNQTLERYRGVIMLVVLFTIIMGIYLLIDNKIKKKKEGVVI